MQSQLCVYYSFNKHLLKMVYTKCITNGQIINNYSSHPPPQGTVKGNKE